MCYNSIMNSTEKNNKKTFKEDLIELIRFTFTLLIIIIPLRVFVAQPFIVNGKSMVPNLEHGDYLIIDQVSYRFNEPERGDVVVFHFPTEYRRFLIKRIIGLPGETITIDGSKVTITQADGKIIQLDEPYINSDYSSYVNQEIGPDEYFVMGDNRTQSSDSRSWGTLSRDLIVGKTFLRLFPFTNIDYLPAQENLENYTTTLN